ncbi:MAG: DUF3857 domain-containing protein [Candidatus Eisenbacteria bacterium]
MGRTVRPPACAVHLLLPLMLICLLPTSARSLQTFKDWIPVPREQWTIAESDSPAVHHAVMLYDGHRIDESDRSGLTTYSRYFRVRVLDSKGVDDFLTVEIPFEKGWKIQGLHARTVKPTGETIEVGEKEIYDKTVFAIGKRRSKAKAFAFKGVEPGDIVEAFFTLRYDEIMPMRIQLRHRVHVVESSLRWYYFPQPNRAALVDATEEELDSYSYAPAYVIPNGKAFHAAVQEFGDPKDPEGLEVSFHDLPALPDETLMPPSAVLAVWFAGHYQFPRREAKKPYWEDVAKLWGKSTVDFLRRQSQLASWMQDILDRPRSLEDDLRLCCERIHRDIANSDLLEDSELPEDLPENDTIDDLLKERIGDGLQIDYLLVAMLEKLGYDASLFYSRNVEDGLFIPELKSAHQFNTTGVAFKEAGGEVRYCQPQFATSSVEALPWQICDTKAMIEDRTRKNEFGPFPTLNDLPASESSGNEMELRMRLRPTADGKLAGQLRAEWSLRNDPYFVQWIGHVAHRSAKEAHEILRERALRSGLSWTAYGESLSVGADRIAYACSLEVDGLIETAGDMRLVHVGALRADDFSLPESDRSTNIHFHHPMRYGSHVEILLDDGAQVTTEPPALEVLESFAEFRATGARSGSSVLLHRDLRIPHSMYRSTAGPAFQQFFRRIYEATEQPLVLSAAREQG